MSGPTSKCVAANVERLRRARQLHQKDLSARLAEVGRPMLPTVISKIERNERRVDVDDLVALALALNVSPLDLLLPPSATEEPCDLTGSQTVTARTAWQWALGRRPAMDWEPGEGVNLASPGADPAIAQEAYERELDYSRQRTEYMRLSMPLGIRQSDDHPLVRVASQLRDYVTDIAVAPGDRDDRLRWIRMAKRRVNQIDSNLEEVAEVLETGDGLDELKAQFPGLVSHVVVHRDGSGEDVSHPRQDS